MRWITCISIFVALTVIPPAFAKEIMTACPATKPDAPNIPFRYGEIWPEGYRTHFESDKVTRRKGLAYVEFKLSDYNSDKAVLMCEFKDRTRIEIPLPGLLLRCQMTIRNYDSKLKPTEWLDVWCVSDDERKAEPKKK